MKRRLKINAAIIFLAVSTLALFPLFFIRHHQTGAWDEIAEIFGIAAILIGQLFRVSARGYKAEHSCQGHALIQGGPYSLIRNPMYLGILLIEIGIALLLLKWWVTFILLIVFIFSYVRLIAKEEKKLYALFPQAYPDYCRVTPRLFPSLASVFTRDVRQILPLRITWMKKEIIPILVVLFCTLVVEGWLDIRHEGFQVYIKESVMMLVVVVLFIIFAMYLNISMSAGERCCTQR